MRIWKRKKLEEQKPAEEEPTPEMGFFDHLGELRKRIIWAVVGIIAGCIVSGIYINDILDAVLLKPASNVGLQLQNLKPFGQPFLYFKVIFISGLILAIPIVLFQLWKFIAPGLYLKERRWVRSITFFTTFCFFSGVAFSYFVLIPSMLKFAAAFGSDKIKNIIDVNEYLSFITMILLASGVMFEMPMVSFVLSRFGILSSQFMRKYRRHSIIVILILAAVLTPTPDPVSQLIFASPLFILYEISIYIAKITERKQKEKEG
ncbi:MAG: tatC [Ignavibacteria bacterium]|nr:tatC [Ignavibacteria bacterium]